MGVIAGEKAQPSGNQRDKEVESAADDINHWPPSPPVLPPEPFSIHLDDKAGLSLVSAMKQISATKLLD